MNNDPNNLNDPDRLIDESNNMLVADNSLDTLPITGPSNDTGQNLSDLDEDLWQRNNQRAKRARFIRTASIILVVLISLIVGGMLIFSSRQASDTNKPAASASVPLTSQAANSLRLASPAPEDALVGGRLKVGGVLQVQTVASGDGTNGFTTSLSFAATKGSNKTIAIPNASGTVAVAGSGLITVDSNGTIACVSCMSSGSSIPAPASTVPAPVTPAPATPGSNGVTSLNAINGAVTLQGTASQILIANDTSGRSVTLSLAQDIGPSASPSFAGLTLSGPLAVSSGGTGTNLLSVGGVVLSNGSAPLTSINGVNGQCLIVNGGTPVFGVCPGANGVSSLNGQNGALTLANASAAAGVITIDNATTSAKGIASFNATNFTVANGAVNTVQDIATGSTPTFAGLNLSNALSVANGGTGAITAAGARANLGAAASGANSDITSLSGLTTPLSVFQGGTGAASFSDGQLLIGNSATSGLSVATLTAGSGVSIVNGNGAVTISAPLAGTCASCANLALSNLSGVAINTSLLPGVTNTIDTGSAAKTFRDGYYGTSVRAPLYDTISAGALSIGTTTATSINLGANTSVAANKTFTANGTALFKSASDSSTALQVQNSAGTALLTADTSLGKVTVGTFTPTILYNIPPPTYNYYTTGFSPLSVIKADFNGDGTIDLATLNSSSTTVSIFIGAGNGTFANKVDYAANGSVTAFDTGDFNSDGRPDLVTSNSTSNNISVLMNNGNGTFATKVDYVTGNYPYGVTVADFNGDGKADIASANNTANNISVLMNNGNGTFATKVDYAAPGAFAIISSDLNGDGRSDLVVQLYNQATFSVFINNGNGTFAPKVNYATGTGSPNTQDIVAGDFNGDGKIDLIVSATSSPLAVFIGSGTGTFATGVNNAVAGNVGVLKAIDFDGDGLLDVVSQRRVDPDFVSVFLNAGAASFGSRIDYPTNNSGMTSFAIANFNGDSTLDIASTHTTTTRLVITLLSPVTGAPVAQNPAKFIVNASANVVGQAIQGAIGQTADLFQVRDNQNATLFSVTAAGVTTAQTLTVAGTATIATLNAATATVSSAFTANGPVLFKNTVNSAAAFQVQQANGTVVMGVNTSTGNVGIGNGTPANKLSVNALTTPDATAQLAVGTGAAANKGIIVQGVAGQTADLFQTQTSNGTSVASIGATGNTTLKNSVDSATAFQIQNSVGTKLLTADTSQSVVTLGTFTPTIVYSIAPSTYINNTTGTTPQSVIKADFNSDGIIDLATVNSGASSVSIFIGVGNGTFAAKVDYTIAGPSISFDTADFNSDGKPDLVTANASGNSVSVLMNNGNGTFATKVDYATGTFTPSVTTVDFSGDGKADIAVVNQSSNTLSVLMNNGNGTFATKVDYAAGFSPNGIVSADLNGDSRSDLIIRLNNQATFSVFMNNGNGTFAAKVDYATGTGSTQTYDLVAGDFNGDGKVDVVVTANVPLLAVFIGSGTGTFATGVNNAVSGNVRYLKAIDFNADGLLDIVANRFSNPDFVSVFLNLGGATFGSRIDFATLNNNLSSFTIANFNGDATLDIASTHSGTSLLVVNLLGAVTGTPTAQNPARFIVNANASVVGQAIQGAIGQTADLFQVRDNQNATLFSVTAAGTATALNLAVTGTTTTGALNATVATISSSLTANGPVLFKNTTNSTAAFQIQQANATVLLGVNTTTGQITLASAAVTGALTLNGHVITGGTAPTIAAGTSACTTPTVAVAGNDTSGTVTITTGTGCVASGVGTMAVVTFNAPFTTAPRIILTPSNAAAAGLNIYNGTVTTTTFAVNTATVPADATNYQYTYWAVQ